MCGGVDEDVSETCKSVRVNKGEYILKNKYYNLEKNGGKSYTLTLKQSPTLYQYRTINKYTTDALLNSEVFATVPASFNDPYDSSWCYDEKRIKKEIAKRIPNGEEEQYRNAIIKDFENTIDGSFDLIETIFERLVIGSIKNHKEGICVSCYSERIDSEIMWAHYANSAKGFALQYNGKDLEECAENHRKMVERLVRESEIFGAEFEEPKMHSLLPVVYQNKKVNINEQIIDSLDLLFDYYRMIIDGTLIQEAREKYRTNTIQNINLQASDVATLQQTVICRKNMDWKYEKEWRIWSYNSNSFGYDPLNNHVLLGNVKPQALYLGEYISEYDKIAMCTIADDCLKIPVYEMKSKMYRNNFRLCPVRLL